MGTLCNPGSWTVDAHGDIPACVEVKLVDFPDAGYYSTNTPRPQGEIWIRGKFIHNLYEVLKYSNFLAHSSRMFESFTDI